jgi:hypothetical protein
MLLLSTTLCKFILKLLGLGIVLVLELALKVLLEFGKVLHDSGFLILIESRVLQTLSDHLALLLDFHLAYLVLLLDLGLHFLDFLVGVHG